MLRLFQFLLEKKLKSAKVRSRTSDSSFLLKNLNKLIIKYQSHPKSRKINAGQKICFCHKMITMPLFLGPLQVLFCFPTSSLLGARGCQCFCSRCPWASSTTRGQWTHGQPAPHLEVGYMTPYGLILLEITIIPALPLPYRNYMLSYVFPFHINSELQ